MDVDCTAYFESLTSDPAVRPRDQVDAIGAFDHSWHIGNRVFARDLFETLRGDADRAEISTRTRDMSGRLELAPPL